MWWLERERRDRRRRTVEGGASRKSMLSVHFERSCCTILKAGSLRSSFENFAIYHLLSIETCDSQTYVFISYLPRLEIKRTFQATKDPVVNSDKNLQMFQAVTRRPAISAWARHLSTQPSQVSAEAELVKLRQKQGMNVRLPG